MNIYVSVEIKTRQATFRRVNTSLYDIVVDGGTWNPPAGVLLYPDRRAKAMSVWALDGEDHRASGEIALSFADGVTQSSSGAITITIDYNDNQESVVVEVPVGDGEGLDSVATDIQQHINNSVDFGPYHSSAPDANNVLTMQATLVGPTYNGTMTLDGGGTGVVGTSVDITGGTKEDFRLVKNVKLTASKTGNYAFALVDAINMSSFESEQTIRPDGYNDKQEIYGNRVKVSQTNQPILFEAENTYYPGKNTADQVVGFGVNTLAVSQGQFGQFPLFVLLKDSIWLLEQSTDPLVAFARISPYSQTHGADSGDGITNIDRSIAFIDGDNIYVDTGGRLSEIGHPIRELLSGGETLYYYEQGDQKELRVITDTRILAYSLTYQRWYGLGREVKRVFRIGGSLYSILSDGRIYDEYDLSDDAVEVSLALQPVHYGLPDALKHLYDVVLRGQMGTRDAFNITFEQSGKVASANGKVIKTRRYPSDFSYTLTLRGQMTPGTDHYIQAFDTRFDLRYGRRTRAYKTTPQP